MRESGRENKKTPRKKGPPCLCVSLAGLVLIMQQAHRRCTRYAPLRRRRAWQDATRAVCMHAWRRNFASYGRDGRKGRGHEKNRQNTRVYWLSHSRPRFRLNPYTQRSAAESSPRFAKATPRWRYFCALWTVGDRSLGGTNNTTSVVSPMARHEPRSLALLPYTKRHPHWLTS